MYRYTTNFDNLPNALAMKNKGYIAINVAAYEKVDISFVYPFCIIADYYAFGITRLNKEFNLQVMWIKRSKI